MPLAQADRSVLVVIDLQGKLMKMVERPELVLEANLRLLEMADLFEVPVLLTEQYPKGIGPTHPRVMERFEALKVPHERIEKTAFGCCGEQGFEAALRRLRPGLDRRQRQLVVGGIEAQVCVMQTVLESLRAGDEVHLSWEATSGRGAEHRAHALERMRQAGAEVTSLESVGFEWARTKDHPAFEAWSALLKQGQLG